jgi:uncharacterized protein YndB with AHSA1/START domain
VATATDSITSGGKDPLVARAEVTIDASRAEVWDALVNPDLIKRYMFGATVTSDWTVGSPITWKGEWKGKPYEDKGRILEIRRDERLKYSHFSPLAGAPDQPENYHNVTIDVGGRDGAVQLALSQDHNRSQEAMEESQRNWRAMLEGLKKAVEH